MLKLNHTTKQNLESSCLVHFFPKPNSIYAIKLVTTISDIPIEVTTKRSFSLKGILLNLPYIYKQLVIYELWVHQPHYNFFLITPRLQDSSFFIYPLNFCTHKMLTFHLIIMATSSTTLSVRESMYHVINRILYLWANFFIFIFSLRCWNS